MYTEIFTFGWLVNPTWCTLSVSFIKQEEKPDVPKAYLEEAPVATDLLDKVRTAYGEAVLTGSAEAAQQVIDQGLLSGIIPSKHYLED